MAIHQFIPFKICTYCDKAGHTVNDCLLRIYADTAVTDLVNKSPDNNTDVTNPQESGIPEKEPKT
jgi:hypothetical protein